jgi:hypothetical protein
MTQASYASHNECYGSNMLMLLTVVFALKSRSAELMQPDLDRVIAVPAGGRLIIAIVPVPAKE